MRWPFRAQHHAVVDNGLWAIRTRGLLRTTGNAPYVSANTYKRVPSPPLAKYRHPFTMNKRCDMADRPCHCRPGIYPTPTSMWGQRGGLSAPNTMLLLTMGCEQSGREAYSALQAMYPMSQPIPIRESHPLHLPSIGIHLPWISGVTWLTGHAHCRPGI